MSFPTAKQLVQITGGFFALLSGSVWAQTPTDPQAPPPPAEQPGQPPAAPGGPVSQSIWPGIVRWYPSAEAKDEAPPSRIVQIPASRFGPGPEDPRIVPVFENADGVTTAHITIEPGTSLYGGGVVPGPLVLNGRKFIAAPADRDLQPPAEHAASLATPWIVAVRPDGTAFGVVADTTWRTEIDLTDGITLRADGPTLPIIIVDADSPLSPPAALSQAAGWQELPPRWAFGLNLSLVVVDTGMAGVLDKAQAWRAHTLPGDALWLYGGSLMAPGLTPQAGVELGKPVAELHSSGWHVGARIDPGLWVSASTRAWYDEGAAAGHWVRGADAAPYAKASPWEQVLAIPDVSREGTRRWWPALYRPMLSARFDAVAHHHLPYTSNAVAMNHWIPDHVRHDADAELGGEATHAELRAIHDALLARSARDALKSAFPDKRPFVATLAPSLISQRYAAAFVRTPRDGAVSSAIGTVLNGAMSGQAIIGVDVPGGDHSGDGSDLARNIAAAAMLPLLRLDEGAAPEPITPWSFSPEVITTCREALERRSRLLPYIYTLALDAYRYGFPMIRPLMTVDPANPALRAVEDAFLLGGDLLVRLKSPGGEPDPASVLPGWRKFDFGEESPLLPEIYIRPGAIIPVAPVMQHDGEKPLEPLTLLVCLNAEGQAMGCLYEDDGTTLEYLKTQCRIAYYQATREGEEVKVRMIRLDGGMGMAKRKLNVRVLLPEGKEATAEYWDALDTKVKLP